MKKYKVVYFNVDDNLDYENQLLHEWGVDDIELVEAKDSNDKFYDYVKGADGLVVEFFPLTDVVIHHLAHDNLKIIALQAIGYSNVDVKEACEHNVCVTNIPGFCTPEVATHAVGFMIDCARKISLLDRSVRAGKWDPLLGRKALRMAGKTVGMVFFGSIPKYMVPILKSLEMEVQVYAPTKSKEYLAEFGCKKIDTLEELMASSDYVSLHCPLNDATRHMIGEKELKLMKKTAFLINTARGSVVDEPALVKALKEGWIAGAAVDVIEDEINEKSDLFELENVVITPHSAFVSDDSFYEGRRMSLKMLVERLSEQKVPANLVNKEIAGKIVFDK